MDLRAEISQLRKEKDAVILAHYYQDEAIQEIADYVGDSLELAKKAAETDAKVIVFAGVHFMAETAKILNPDKKILLPDLEAGCSLADSCPPERMSDFLEKHPGHKLIVYINCSAEIKAMSDIVCTSSNAEKVIRSFPPEEKLIFAPDKNLGAYLAKVTGRDLVLWEGACIVHEAFSIDKLLQLKLENPQALLIAHPESEAVLLEYADFIGSTSQLLRFVKENKEKTFIVATEAGILHKMQQEAPNTRLIPAPAHENNTCACSECAFMKVNTLEKLRDCLRDEKPEIILDEDLMNRARTPILKMFAIS